MYAVANKVKPANIVSVPFPGILFLNKQVSNVGRKLENVSVPFPGILFLNKEIREAVKAYKDVSVPFPGILFLNPVLYMPDLNWIPKPNCGAKPNPTLE